MDIIRDESASILRAIRAERRSITLPPVLRADIQFASRESSGSGAPHLDEPPSPAPGPKLGAGFFSLRELILLAAFALAAWVVVGALGVIVWRALGALVRA